MTNPSREELVSAYIDNQLDEAAAAKVRLMIEGDTQLRELEQGLRDLSRQIRAIPEKRLPAGFAHRVLNSIQNVSAAGESVVSLPTRIDSETGPRSSLVRGRSSRWKIGLGLIATVAASFLAITLWNPQLWQFGNVNRAVAIRGPGMESPETKKDQNSKTEAGSATAAGSAEKSYRDSVSIGEMNQVGKAASDEPSRQEMGLQVREKGFQGDLGEDSVPQPADQNLNSLGNSVGGSKNSLEMDLVQSRMDDPEMKKQQFAEVAGQGESASAFKHGVASKEGPGSDTVAGGRAQQTLENKTADDQMARDGNATPQITPIQPGVEPGNQPARELAQGRTRAITGSQLVESAKGAEEEPRRAMVPAPAMADSASSPSQAAGAINKGIAGGDRATDKNFSGGADGVRSAMDSKYGLNKAPADSLAIVSSSELSIDDFAMTGIELSRQANAWEQVMASMKVNNDVNESGPPTDQQVDLIVFEGTQAELELTLKRVESLDKSIKVSPIIVASDSKRMNPNAVSNSESFRPKPDRPSAPKELQLWMAEQSKSVVPEKGGEADDGKFYYLGRAENRFGDNADLDTAQLLKSFQEKLETRRFAFQQPLPAGQSSGLSKGSAGELAAEMAGLDGRGGGGLGGGGAGAGGVLESNDAGLDAAAGASRGTGSATLADRGGRSAIENQNSDTPASDKPAGEAAEGNSMDDADAVEEIRSQQDQNEQEIMQRVLRLLIIRPSRK